MNKYCAQKSSSAASCKPCVVYAKNGARQQNLCASPGDIRRNYFTRQFAVTERAFGGLLTVQNHSWKQAFVGNRGEHNAGQMKR